MPTFDDAINEDNVHHNFIRSCKHIKSKEQIKSFLETSFYAATAKESKVMHFQSLQNWCNFTVQVLSSTGQ